MERPLGDERCVSLRSFQRDADLLNVLGGSGDIRIFPFPDESLLHESLRVPGQPVLAVSLVLGGFRRYKKKQSPLKCDAESNPILSTVLLNFLWS